MGRWKLISLFLGLSLTGIAFSGCSAKLSKIEPSKASSQANETRAYRIGTAVGDIAPDFELTEMDGSRLKRADLNGQPAVLIFWTAWCPVCKEEAPEFNKLAAQFATRGVRVIGINIQDSVARTEAGIKEFGIQYTVARDPDAAVTRRYKVSGTPTIVFIDPTGVVRYFGNELPVDYPSRLVTMLEQKVKGQNG
jgi:peroxiredoxin